MGLNMYTPEGWFNTPALAALKDINFFVIIGPRQVGKTYSTAKCLLDLENPFIYMRRTPSEVLSSLNSETSTFNDMKADYGYDFEIKPGPIVTDIGVIRPGEEEVSTNCIAMALSAVARVRGFNGQKFKELMYDEFIPEVSARKFRAEDDAFLNAYTTLNGNRELRGEKPLRVWLLANANNIYSPILAALGLVKKIEDMIAKGQEYSIMPDRGICICLPQATKIIEQRKKSALYRATGLDSSQAKMALENKFAYNVTNDIISIDISTNWVPKFTIGGQVTFYQHRDSHVYYACHKVDRGVVNMPIDASRSARVFQDKLQKYGQAYLYEDLVRGRIIYSSYEVKRYVMSFFNLGLGI